MIDHLGLRVSEYAKSKRFFESALAPLGYQVVMEFGGSVAGLGAAGKPDFWISQGEAAGAGPRGVRESGPRDRGRVSPGRARRWRERQWASRSPSRVPSELLRGFRARSGRKQRRGGVSPARVESVTA